MNNILYIVILACLITVLVLVVLIYVKKGKSCPDIIGTIRVTSSGGPGPMGKKWIINSVTDTSEIDFDVMPDKWITDIKEGDTLLISTQKPDGKNYMKFIVSDVFLIITTSSMLGTDTEDIDSLKKCCFDSNGKLDYDKYISTYKWGFGPPVVLYSYTADMDNKGKLHGNSAYYEISSGKSFGRVPKKGEVYYVFKN